ncbi:MAG: AAA family ATPase [Lachnospiraceae bacterium]|nr:AAA family ATPase [Lachnospiraceae bacterium]
MGAFERVIGYEDIKEELQRMCDVLKNPAKYRRLGVSMPRGVMIYGNPGVGKTLMATCFIEESGQASYIVRKDKPENEFIECIRETFDKAGNNEPSIILLDDLDKFIKQREEYGTPEIYAVVQSCMDSVEGKDVFVIATTNDIHILPDSLKREGRFSKLIEVPNPKLEVAEQIVKHSFGSTHISQDVDPHEVARFLEGKSCDALRNVVNEAGIFAGYDGRKKIEHEDIIRACMRVIFRAPECERSSSNELREHVAVHEAGHTVVSEVLYPGSVSVASVRSHRGNSYGITKYHDHDGFELSKINIENNIVRTLAGKAAVEVTFGIADAGAWSDINSAYESVKKCFTELCFFGFNDIEDGAQMSYPDSDRMRMAAMLERYYQEAKRIIAENREFFNAVVKALTDKQTITYKDIEKIKDDTTEIKDRLMFLT